VGLALVRHIVEAHGGTVTVESAQGQGSRFTLWLPLGPHRDLEGRHGSAGAPRAAPGGLGGPFEAPHSD
ncbi:MAG TPA: ATP-binding protein, partial [Solirubrobacterales bacterium]|nr:ATP-binding protein [Solirubrobacterales bacterium]